MVHWGIFRPNAVPKEVLSGQVPALGMVVCIKPPSPPPLAVDTWIALYQLLGISH